MIHFPQNSSMRAGRVQALPPLRLGLTRDVLWNRPLFKAPALSNPPIAVDPLPFFAARVTQRAVARPAAS